MNILFIINSFASGGAETLVCQLACALTEHATQVTVAALYANNDLVAQEMLNNLHARNIKTYVLNKRAGKDRFKTVGALRKIIKENKINLIHAHCQIPMLMGKLAGLLTRVPVVCTVHSTADYSALQERLTSWMSNKYVAIGQAAQEYMTGPLHIPASKITRIYNAINTTPFTTAQKDPHFWEQFGGKEGDIALIHVARVHPAKNQICLLRAMAELKKQNLTPYKLYILGAYLPEDKTYRELANFIRQNALEETVHFLGAHANVADYLVNSDCFLMTSHFEGFSLSFLEAVISGLPIISTDLPFVRNLNKIAPCALVIPQDDSHALAELIKTNRFRTLTVPGKLFAQQFSIQTCARAHADLYKELLKL